MALRGFQVFEMHYKVKHLMIYVNMGADIPDILYHPLIKVSKSDDCKKIDEESQTMVKDAHISTVENLLHTLSNETYVEKWTKSSPEVKEPDYKYFSCRLELDAHLASCLMCDFKLFSIFRKRLFNYVKKNYTFQYVGVNFGNSVEEQQVTAANRKDGRKIPIDYVIEIIPIYPKQKVDYAWTYRIGGQMVKKMLLEEAFAWFSTLGGAYSSLGDHFSSFAEHAGKIAMKQLKIANEEGDPIMACKAKLFFAQSLMQRGYIIESGRIFKAQSIFAKTMIVPDSKLLTMCRALRKRWKYIRSNVNKHVHVLEN